jgi:hypothetical protein
MCGSRWFWLPDVEVHSSICLDGSEQNNRETSVRITGFPGEFRCREVEEKKKKSNNSVVYT